MQCPRCYRYCTEEDVKHIGMCLRCDDALAEEADQVYYDKQRCINYEQSTQSDLSKRVCCLQSTAQKEVYELYYTISGNFLGYSFINILG